MENSSIKPIETVTAPKELSLWQPNDFVFSTEHDNQWNDFSLAVVFKHKSGSEIALDAYWYGIGKRVVRFAPNLTGDWEWFLQYKNEKVGPGFTGSFSVDKATPKAISHNPNLRGHLHVSSNKKSLEYADGQPFFWIGDTNWPINTLRCGLSNKQAVHKSSSGTESPFYTYATDRKEKGFTVIQISFMRSYLGAPQRNEGGFVFPKNSFDADGNPEDNGDFSELNPEYFRYLDIRLQYLWENGFIIAGHPNWLGRHVAIDLQNAVDLHRYLLARYGAYNLVYSITGEYDRATKETKKGDRDYLEPEKRWTIDNFKQLGREVSQFNAYNHPLTIHPSGHDASSSIHFHNEQWLDINWTQVGGGAKGSGLHKIFQINSDTLSQNPQKPVVHSESQYEGNPMDYRQNGLEDVCTKDTVRFEAWAGFMSGACGHTYGAHGIWQFYDPNAEKSDLSRVDFTPPPWWEALSKPGAVDVNRIKEFFTTIGLDTWKSLVPERDKLLIHDELSGKATTPDDKNWKDPYCLLSDTAAVIYIPHGNGDRTISLVSDTKWKNEASWFNPRNGEWSDTSWKQTKDNHWELPSCPGPYNREENSGEDWIFYTTME